MGFEVMIEPFDVRPLDARSHFIADKLRSDQNTQVIDIEFVRGHDFELLTQVNKPHFALGFARRSCLDTTRVDILAN